MLLYESPRAVCGVLGQGAATVTSPLVTREVGALLFHIMSVRGGVFAATVRMTGGGCRHRRFVPRI